MILRRIISEREEELQEGELGKLLKIAVEDKNVISFGPGEPDFLPPKHVIKAAKKYLDEGYTHYSPPPGRKELLEALSKKLKKENRIERDPEEIVVTNGSNEAIMLALMALIDPGEFCIVPDPGFIDYIPTVEILNGYPISLPLYEKNDFQIDPDDLKNLIKEPKKTKALIINTPGNPTGNVLTKKTLEEIADIANEFDLIIISDEAYEKFIYRGKHISIGSLNGIEDRVLSLHSFSKTYGMAGFRVGYASGPKNLIDAMRNLHLYSTICAPTISQMAALAALKGPQGEIKKIVREYKIRKKLIVKLINETKYLECLDPAGAFYVFARYNFDMPSRDFAKRLLNEAKVAVIPGRDFGRYGEGYVRFSYATSKKLIESGMGRLTKALEKFK